MLWLSFAVVTAAILAVLVRPLLTSRATAARRADYDLAVFRDQLAEVDRDLGRGLLTADQAGAARIEIQRRMLAAADSSEAPATAADPGARRAAAIGIAVLMPVAALATYLMLGAPHLPGQPFAERQRQRLDMAPDEADRMIALVEQLAERMRTNPDNVEGWLMLGRSYRALGRHGEAAAAYDEAVRRGAGDADTLSTLGESLVLADGRGIPATAEDAFRRALAQDPGEPRARYYLGAARLAAGDARGAIAIWRDLEKDSAEDAPWLPTLRERIAKAAAEAGLDPATIAPAAAAAPQLSEQENEMVRQMVANLAAKLEQNPNDAEGWQRLGRSYRVMGDLAKARDAYARAVALLPGNADVRLAYAALLLSATPEGAATLPAEFVTVMREILAIDPASRDALWFVGLAEAQAGNAEAARGLWTKLRDSLPEESSDRRDIEMQIRSLAQ